MTISKLSLPAFSQLSPNVQGVLFLIAGMVVLSLQNIMVRAIDERYAVLEIVVIRSLIAIPLTLLFYRYEGYRGLPRTTQYGLHFWRGFLLPLMTGTGQERTFGDPAEDAWTWG